MVLSDLRAIASALSSSSGVGGCGSWAGTRNTRLSATTSTTTAAPTVARNARGASPVRLSFHHRSWLYSVWAKAKTPRNRLQATTTVSESSHGTENACVYSDALR